MAFISKASDCHEGPVMTAQAPTAIDAGLNLALAIVASSSAPMILLDEALVVIAASSSFCQAFGIPVESAAGCSVFGLGDGEWDSPGLRSLLEATAFGAAEIESYEMGLVGKYVGRRRLVLHAQKLDYDPAAPVRLLLAVTDVSEGRRRDREKEALERDNALLLLEVHHRVANSLQIIASVLLQTARRVQSAETKVHLHDAHHRLMAIAAVQHQLAGSEAGFVELRTYFTRLCASLGASMIRDPSLITIEVDVDDDVVTADVSVSLGLVVTELVINALKHAFPDQRGGKIVVVYRSLGAGWILSVADDGVGLGTAKGESKPGLGTSIVQALSHQLRASLRVADTAPGMMVSLMHDRVDDADIVANDTSD
jgi:two-component sensor histidine kinase